MKKPLSQTLILIGAITLLSPLAGRGQDFFRDLGTSRSSGGMGPVVPSDYTYEDGSPSGLRALRPGQEMSVRHSFPVPAATREKKAEKKEQKEEGFLDSIRRKLGGE